MVSLAIFWSRSRCVWHWERGQQRAISNAIDTVNKDPIHNKAIENHGSFCQMMNEWRIQLSIYLTKNGLLLNLRIIAFITALLIFTMARIVFNTKIIIEKVKDVWCILLILLMNNNFSIFRCVEYFVCYWLLVRLSCYKNVKLERWKWNRLIT